MKSIRFSKLFLSSVAALSLSMTSPSFAGGYGLIAKLLEEAGGAIAGVLVKSADNAVISSQKALAEQAGVSIRAAFKALNIDTSSDTAFNQSLEALGDTSEAIAFRDAVKAATDFDANTVLNLGRKANALLASRNSAVTGMDALLKEATSLVSQAEKASKTLEIPDAGLVAAKGGSKNAADRSQRLLKAAADGSGLEESLATESDDLVLKKALALLECAQDKRCNLLTPEQKTAVLAIFENPGSSHYRNLSLVSVMKGKNAANASDQLDDEGSKTLVELLEEAKAKSQVYYKAFEDRAIALKDDAAKKEVDELVGAGCFL
jgi:hypothetical protein